MSEESGKYEVRRPYKPRILIDFDGVVHRYQSGWQGETAITEPPVDGAKQGIDELRKEYKGDRSSKKNNR